MTMDLKSSAAHTVDYLKLIIHRPGDEVEIILNAVAYPSRSSQVIMDHPFPDSNALKKW